MSSRAFQSWCNEDEQRLFPLPFSIFSFYLQKFYHKSLAGAAETAERKLVEVSSRRAADVLRTELRVAVEVHSTVVGVCEETSPWTYEIDSAAASAVSVLALSASEGLADWTSEKLREEDSNAVGLSHADVVNVGIQRPGAHVSDVVAGELRSVAKRTRRRQGAVVCDRVEGKVTSAHDVNCDQVRTRGEAHVIHLAVEWVGAESIGG